MLKKYLKRDPAILRSPVFIFTGTIIGYMATSYYLEMRNDFPLLILVFLSVMILIGESAITIHKQEDYFSDAEKKKIYLIHNVITTVIAITVLFLLNQIADYL